MVTIIINIVIIILLIVLLIYVTTNKTKSKKNNFSSSNIEFYDQHKAKHFILLDADNYIKQMSNLDLQARGYNKPAGQYIIDVANSMKDFTHDEKKELMSKMQKLDKKAFMPNRINFIKMGSTIYENGFPHTRENVIFLPWDFLKKPKEEQMEILYHECIHIYQRYHPTETELFLNRYQFQKVGNFKELFPNEYKLRRSNPDLDDNIWKDPSGNLMFPIFSSPNPNSLYDVKDSKMEHPYEWMAYTLSKNIFEFNYI